MSTALEKRTIQELEFKKHVNLIHCTNSLTLVQRKLLNGLLCNAYPDLPHKSQHEISVRALCLLIGYNSQDYAKLKKALMGLITTAIEWNIIEENKDVRWQASAILSAAKIEKGLCTYEYSSIMRDLLFKPEIFQKLDMSVISKFKSGYSLALYENCARYQKVNHTPLFPIEIFRKLMGAFGESYKCFRSFNNRILTPAVDEINKISSFYIDPEIKRVNQSVTAIGFKIDTKSKKFFETSAELNKYEKLIGVLKNEFHMGAENIEDLINTYNYTKIIDKISYIKSTAAFANKSIINLSGYLITALKKDFKSIAIFDDKEAIIELNKQLKEQHDLAKRNEGLRAKTDAKRAEYIIYKNNLIDHYLSGLQVEKLEQIVTEFLQYLKKISPTHLFLSYKKMGLEHKVVRIEFNNYLFTRTDLSLPSIIPFEDFLDSH